MKVTLRRPETQKIYEAEMAKMKNEKGCRLCKIPVIREIGKFVIVHNEYPYDKLFKIDDMLMLKSCRKNLTPSEMVELDIIKKWLSDEGSYDYVFENLPNQASVVDHWHCHLFKR